MVKTKDLFKTNYTYIIGISIGVVLVVALISIFVIKPFINKANSLNQDVKTEKLVLQALEDKKNKLDKLKDKEEELKADAKTVVNALPDNKEAGRLFIQIDGLAKENGGNVKSITEGGVSVGSQGNVSQTATGLADIQKLTYTIPIDFTSYFSFKDFITKSETALRLVNIDSFTINTTEKGTLAVDLGVTTYVKGK